LLYIQIDDFGICRIYIIWEQSGYLAFTSRPVTFRTRFTTGLAIKDHALPTISMHFEYIATPSGIIAYKNI